MQIYIFVIILYYLISGEYCLIINYPKNIQMQYLYGKKLSLLSPPRVSVACPVIDQFPHHEVPSMLAPATLNNG